MLWAGSFHDPLTSRECGARDRVCGSALLLLVILQLTILRSIDLYIAQALGRILQLWHNLSNNKWRFIQRVLQSNYSGSTGFSLGSISSFWFSFTAPEFSQFRGLCKSVKSTETNLGKLTLVRRIPLRFPRWRALWEKVPLNFLIVHLGWICGRVTKGLSGLWYEKYQ